MSQELAVSPTPFDGSNTIIPIPAWTGDKWVTVLIAVPQEVLTRMVQQLIKTGEHSVTEGNLRVEYYPQDQPE